LYIFEFLVANAMALFSSSKIPEKCTMQKEDSPSHQTCDTCMEY
jgi:hypothetical protein